MAIKENNWYEFDGAEQVDSPALIIYPQRVIQNIEHLKSMVSSPDLLRPHIKTHKSAEITKLMILHGINKFKCATIAEAELLGICSAKDVLLAYQPGKIKLQRLFEIMDTYPGTKFSCLVDNLGTAEMISELSQKRGHVFPVYIDLNVGMNRTGVLTALAFDLFVQLQSLKGIQIMGFHAYDGHIRETDPENRALHCQQDFGPVEQLRNKIQENGYAFPLLIAGGSPTSIIHSKRQHTESSPGTFVFWDKGYHDTIPEQNFLFAALVMSRVVSLPDESKICIDLGYKSVSSENELQNRVFFLNAPHLTPCSHSEEHMVIEAGKAHGYKIGDIFYALPYHICPTVAMFRQATTVANDTLGPTWTVEARDREINI